MSIIFYFLYNWSLCLKIDKITLFDDRMLSKKKERGKKKNSQHFTQLHFQRLSRERERYLFSGENELTFAPFTLFLCAMPLRKLRLLFGNSFSLTIFLSLGLCKFFSQFCKKNCKQKKVLSKKLTFSQVIFESTMGTLQFHHHHYFILFYVPLTAATRNVGNIFTFNIVYANIHYCKKRVFFMCLL